MNRMMMRMMLVISAVVIAGAAHGQDLVREQDRIDVPAIGDGLCLHNLFQSNMVLQRDKPIAVWGWAAPGEEVTVAFAGQSALANAGADRVWKVEFPAMAASPEPRRIVIKGKDRTIELENILRRTPPTEVRSNPHEDDMNRPGNCYASMLAPLAGLAVKGAIWHQGYNNAMQPNGHVMYYQVFPKMIEAWRRVFNDPAMPFGIISLCTEGEPQDLDNYVSKMADEGILIREVQYKTFVDLTKAGDRNIGYASSFDQRRAWYHPQIKIPVGERIAQWALATQYGMEREIKWRPPTYKEMVVEDGKILLKGCEAMIAYNDGPILGFAIAGNDGKFQPAKAEHLETGKDGRGRPQVDRGTLALSSPLVPDPVHFRYAWGRNPLANLKAQNNDDIPFATQRSDRWTAVDMYELYTGRKPAESGVLNRGEWNELRKTLQAEDQRRRVFEAESVLKDETLASGR